MAELRSFIFLSRLQPQTMCYLGTWIRGSLPRSHVAAQVIEVAPGLDIEPLTDVAVKHADVKAGILVVERQFGYLEIHGGTDEVQAAASAVLGALGATARDASRPEILASTIITMLDPQQAFLVNRNKIGSMALAGESLFVLEMRPASYAILAANEAEKEMEEAKKALGIPPTMSEHHLVANVKLQKHLIITYGSDPPPGSYISQCCAFCCSYREIFIV